MDAFFLAWSDAKGFVFVAIQAVGYGALIYLIFRFALAMASSLVRVARVSDAQMPPRRLAPQMEGGASAEAQPAFSEQGLPARIPEQTSGG